MPKSFDTCKECEAAVDEDVAVQCPFAASLCPYQVDITPIFWKVKWLYSNLSIN